MERIVSLLSNLRISYRIQLISVVALVGITIVSAVALERIDNLLREDVRIKTKQNVEVAVSILKYYADEVAAGRLAEDVAKNDAIDTIKHMRYNGKEYFWIHDMRVQMIMHPFKPALDGTDISTLKDPHGKALFVEMTDKVKAAGEGFVEYMWPKPDQKDPLPKISYVKGFAPWGWIVGSGVYVDMIDAAVQQQLYDFIFIAVTIMVAIIPISYLLSRTVSRPVQALQLAMQRITGGDLSAEVPALTDRDEVGYMARSVEIFKQQGAAFRAAEEEKAQKEELAAIEKKRVITGMLSKFNGSLGDVVHELSGVIDQAKQQAQTLSTSAQHTCQSTQQILSSSDEAAKSVMRVANASEELSEAILEISKQVQHTTHVVNQAGSVAEKVNNSVARLIEQTTKINQVTDFINGVASEISLLALNATIESARAGDAGKGFAVVASEVKNLATQTTRASEEIAQQIQDIQMVSSETELYIKDIVNTTHQINGIVTTIASAVEQQSAATNVIMRNVSQSASAVEHVSQNIAVVGSNADNSVRASDMVLGMMQKLTNCADDLRERADQFVAGIRSM
jgi:methyl-accepting chemotaxis protein